MGSQKELPFDEPQNQDLWGLDCEFITMDNPDGWQSSQKNDDQKREVQRRARALTAGQRCNYAQKIDFTVRCARKAIKAVPIAQWCLSWSAGNDSTALSLVLRHICKLKITHVMSNTRLEYPETIRNMHAYRRILEADGVPVFVAYPEKRPAEVWKEDGIPLFSKELASKYRQWVKTGNEAHLKQVPEYLHAPFHRLRDAGVMLTEKCCDELKKKPMLKVRKQQGFIGSFTGVRASESMSRRLGFIQRGALYNSTRNRQWICNPIVHWSEEDVQKTLARFGVVLERPGNGSGRSGCVNCGFGCHIASQRGEENSLQMLHRTNIAMWNRTMKEWGFEEACVVAGIPMVSRSSEGGELRENDEEKSQTQEA